MTGYGRGVAPLGNRRVTVQMKSVNHRFVDIKVRGTPLDPAVEDKINQQIRARVQRGAIALTVRIEGAAAGVQARIDGDAARRIVRDLTALARELGIKGDVGLELVCAQPGVILQREADDDYEELGAAVLEALGQALDALIAMRAAEGEALARDLAERVGRVRELAEQIGQLAGTAPQEARDRLRDRLNRLLRDSSATVDESRLAQEIALIADRQDVTEELVRVRSHVDQFLAIMGAGNPAGRRLDFLVQELGREINTIGSKSQSAVIAAVVVDAKAELEKVREQVQNVE
jgi:uncharacterized protein (TIGR00255 family)